MCGEVNHHQGLTALVIYNMFLVSMGLLFQELLLSSLMLVQAYQKVTLYLETLFTLLPIRKVHPMSVSSLVMDSLFMQAQVRKRLLFQA